jgi:hypothetical protein
MRRNRHLDDESATFLRNVGSITVTRRNIPEDGILHSHRRESCFALNLVQLTFHPLWRAILVSPAIPSLPATSDKYQ